MKAFRVFPHLLFEKGMKYSCQDCFFFSNMHCIVDMFGAMTDRLKRFMPHGWELCLQDIFLVSSLATRTLGCDVSV